MYLLPDRCDEVPRSPSWAPMDPCRGRRQAPHAAPQRPQRSWAICVLGVPNLTEPLPGRCPCLASPLAAEEERLAGTGTGKKKKEK